MKFQAWKKLQPNYQKKKSDLKIICKHVYTLKLNNTNLCDSAIKDKKLFKIAFFSKKVLDICQKISYKACTFV